ncbi:hypothetical protein [Miltoncostaea oceani]|uniref:hypothetical protein n=1 Tax=Miltoncostaea oceani TaxID=2843216 RepID=UPI001C3C73A9|nr:hypothetical protein [Miltoncostaea oceani]
MASITIGRTRYKIRNPIRLGIIAVVLMAIAFVGVNSCGGDEVAEAQAALATPANPPCFAGCDTAQPTAYTFPLVGEELDAFVEAAQPVSGLETFYESYPFNRGIPVRFNAYIPTTSNAGNPDYFVRDSAIFVPAVFLPPNNPGFFQQVVTEDGEGQRPVTLGFSRDQVPSSGFIEVFGFIYWSSAFLNPSTLNNQPIVAVGSWTDVSPSQLRAPAVRTWPEAPEGVTPDPALVIRRDNLRMSVQRVEFAPDETRVFLSLRNFSTSTPASYDPGRASLLTADGRELGAVPEAAQSDALDSSNLPAGGQTDERLTRRGYIVFPPVSSSEPVIVSLPDPNGSEDLIRLEVPAPS